MVRKRTKNVLKMRVLIHSGLLGLLLKLSLVSGDPEFSQKHYETFITEGRSIRKNFFSVRYSTRTMFNEHKSNQQK